MERSKDKEPKRRGSPDQSYLGRTIDGMILDFMEEHDVKGLSMAIVQAPYIPRAVGYGVSDAGTMRLASPNTMWPLGPISEGYCAVGVMQLYEDGKLDIRDHVGKWFNDLPESWEKIRIIDLLRHASGLPDVREAEGFDLFRKWTFEELVDLVKDKPLAFAPGAGVKDSATDFLLLSEIIERTSGMHYHDFITIRQINHLGLRHTGFREDLDTKFRHEDVSRTENVHVLFKKSRDYVDPGEPAASYDEKGNPVKRVCSTALRGYGDIWASARDVSFWDIGLAGSILVKKPEDRALIYGPWKLPDGTSVPAVAGWHFYHHKGLMDIRGSVPGYSAFLSRFTDPSELVCVTLLANKEGLDFANLARKIAASYGASMATGFDDRNLFLLESQFDAGTTIGRLKGALERRKIPLFAEFDHRKNALDVGLALRPTDVLVFGSPAVGTHLMEAAQGVALELPLKIAVLEDGSGSVWLAFRKMAVLAEEYGLADHPLIPRMEALMEALAREAGSVY